MLRKILFVILIISASNGMAYEVTNLPKITRVKKDGKYGIIHETGKLLVECIYDHLEIGCDEEYIVAKKDGKAGFIDKKGHIIIPFVYEEVQLFYDELAAVKKNNQYGFIDKKGRLVIDYNYSYALSFIDGFALVKINDNWGVIDKKGNLVIQNTYTRMSPFYNGKSIVEVNDKVGVIDMNGRMVVEPEYDYINFENKQFIVTKRVNDSAGIFRMQEGLLNSEGNVLSPLRDVSYKSLGSVYNIVFPCIKNLINEDDFIFIENEQRNYSLINTVTGEEGNFSYPFLNRIGNGYFSFGASYLGVTDTSGIGLIEPMYNNIGLYSEDLIPVEKNNKWGVVTIKNEMIIDFQYDYISDFHNGIALAEFGNQLLLLEKNGKVNKIINEDNFKIQKAVFNKNYISLKKNEKYGAIDYTGKIVIPFIYDVPIDFRFYNYFNF